MPRGNKSENVCYNFWHYSGVVQSVARQPLELVILVRVQAPEPFLAILRPWSKLLRLENLQVELLGMDGHPLNDAPQSVG